MTDGADGYYLPVSWTKSKKMNTRREFIRSTALALAALPLVSSELTASVKPSRKTGLILYTVREAMNLDPEATLALVAATGYNWIEAADHRNGQFYGMKPREFGKLVKKNGLKVISSHSNLTPDNYERLIGEVAEAGMKYIVLPSLPSDWSGTIDGYQRAADFFNKAGARCKKAGICFGFHNHWAEFSEINGRVPYDVLLERSEPGLVTFEMDIAWITAGGKDPVAYFKNYPGRFELWHLKDLTPDKRDATLGEGIIDFRPILAEARTAGMKYWFIEQDNCRTHTPEESIRISRNYYLDQLA